MSKDRKACDACMNDRWEETNKLADKLRKLERRVLAFLRYANYTDDDIMKILDVDRKQLRIIEHSGTYPWGEN